MNNSFVWVKKKNSLCGAEINSESLVVGRGGEGMTGTSEIKEKGYALHDRTAIARRMEAMTL